MRIVTLPQGTDAWLEWRRGGVGASEVPVLMGESDFSTPLELWKEKVGLKKAQDSNWAMTRGTENEPKVRALYELRYDKEMPAMCAEHEKVPFFRSSFDGYNTQDRKVLEIKYPGKEKFEFVRTEKKIVPCYYGQVQSQMFVADALELDFCCYNGVDIAVATTKPDLNYQALMIEVVSRFWNSYVIPRIAPPLSDRDYKEITDDRVRTLFAEFAAQKQSNAPAKQLELIKKEIIPFLDHPRVVCNGVKVVKNIKGVHTFSLSTEGN